MTVVNRFALLAEPPIRDMALEKHRDSHGVSYGLAEVGYDIRIKQEVKFTRGWDLDQPTIYHQVGNDGFAADILPGRFCLASAMEEFDMPNELTGIVHDKSTWARKGLSVFNTVIEPGWRGFLTLELVYHGTEDLIIPAGSGIAQVIFHQLAIPAMYAGTYQDQRDEPVPSLLTKV